PLVLRQPLHLAEQLDVAPRVPSPTAGTALRTDQSQPVISAQGLRMHPGEFGGDRDHEGAGVVVGPFGPAHPPSPRFMVTARPPIPPGDRSHWPARPRRRPSTPPGLRPPGWAAPPPSPSPRSEERRVGKEGRSRG